MYKERFTAELLKAANVESVIDDASCVDVEAFDTIFRAAAKEADENGNSQRALAFRLFAALVSFHFRPDDRAEPFSNMIGFADGSRSLMASDLDQQDVDELKKVIDDLHVLSLKTRVADVVWSRSKSYANCAVIAVDGYTQMVEALLNGTATLRFENSKPTSVSTQNFLVRGLAIARATGWRRAGNDGIKRAALAVLQKAEEEGGITLVRFGRLALEWGVPGTGKVLSSLPRKVEEALGQHDFHSAEELQKLWISLSQQSKKAPPDKDAYLKLASIHEAQADASDSAFLKTHSLQSAIDSLHDVKDVRDDRQRIHEKLRDAQLHLSDEFTPFSHSINLGDEVKRLLKRYDGLDLLDSIRLLALTELPKGPEELMKSAREEMEKFPLSSLFATSIIDEKGRTRARTAGSADGSDDAVRYKVIQHQDISMGVAVQAAIRPARQLITERFVVDDSLLLAICRMSPFVPRSLEHVFARGMQAFIYGDDQIAGVCLVPAMEAGLRALVTIAGRADTRIAAGGIEQTIGLGPLLSDHRDVLEKVFGDWMIFAIENVFVHPLGPKVRHSVCHGLAPDGAFYSTTYIFACKLIFSLILLPLIGDRWDAVKPQLQQQLRS